METDHSFQPAVTMEAGQEALARAAWEEARACFEAILWPGRRRRRLSRA